MAKTGEKMNHKMIIDSRTLKNRNFQTRNFTDDLPNIGIIIEFFENPNYREEKVDKFLKQDVLKWPVVIIRRPSRKISQDSYRNMTMIFE